MLDLHCCAQVSSSCSEQGLLFVGEQGLLMAVASLTAEHRPQEPGLQWFRTGAQELQLLAFRV